MSDNTTLDNPAPEPEDKDLPSELTLEDAGSALSRLLDDDGTLKDEPPPEDKPQEKQPEPVKAETPEPAALELVEVDIDGYKVQLPKDKADKLNAERLMQADYTRKTMQTAEARKAAEAEQAKAYQERQAARQQLDAIVTTLETAVKTGQLKEPDPSLLDSDPVTYLRQQAQWNQAQTAYAQAQQQRAAIQQQEAHFAHLQRQQILEAERGQLLAKVPEWKDEGKAQAEKAELTQWLLKQGYTPEQIESTTDHRAILAQLKAFRYEKLIEEQRAVIDRKVPPAQTRPVKPGAAQEGPSTPINQAAMQRLRKGGKVDDAAAAIASLLS